MKYKLSDITLNITDGTHSTIKDNPNGDCYLLSCKNIKNDRINISNNERHIDLETLEKLKKRTKISKNDILLTTVGTIGEMAMVPVDDTYYDFQRSVGIIKPNSELVIPKFLFYSIKNEKNQIFSLVKGAVQQCLFLGDLKNLEINLPSLPTQHRIASVLSALDDKIELNNKINKNLEEQAQALYENIFLDSNNFCDLGSVIQTTSGGTPSRKKDIYYENGNQNWVKSKELQSTFIIDTEEKITDDAIKNSSAKLLPANSVLIAMYGATVGEYGIISKEMTCNQAICALIPNENYPFTYLFMFAKNNKQALINLAVGSAQQNISQILIKSFPVCSDIEKTKKFDKESLPIFKKIKLIVEENKHLAELRDTLLPKLMNSEIDVSEVEV